MEAKMLDMSQWVKSGEGAQGESFNHVNDPDYMVKLFNPCMSVKDIENEVAAARMVAELGLPTPEPGEFVTDGVRFGTMFKRIRNKQSYCTAVSKDPSLLPELARKLGQIAKLIHSTKADKSRMVSTKDMFMGWLKASVMPEEQKEMFHRAFELVQDADTCVHGDFHFGNVITDGVKDYIIDVSTFSYGAPEWDLSMFFFVSNDECGGRLEEMFHISLPTAMKFWDEFAQEYFGFKPDRGELFAKYKPYLLLRTLFFEASSGPDDPALPGLRKAFSI